MPSLVQEKWSWWTQFHNEKVCSSWFFFKTFLYAIIACETCISVVNALHEIDVGGDTLSFSWHPKLKKIKKRKLKN